MTSGWDGYQLSKTETLTIGNNSQPQSQYPDHPRKIDGATGGFLNNDFITCGGYDTVEGYTDKCYKLGSEVPFATMMTKRWRAASIVLEPGKLWILGGVRDDGRLSSTEYIFADGINEDGPPMPIALASHSMVKINDTTSILVGGFIGSGSSRKSWYYEGKWLDGPDLQKARNFHSVELIRDSVTAQVYVVVAGGWDSSCLTDVEIMDLQENKWETGKLF